MGTTLTAGLAFLAWKVRDEGITMKKRYRLLAFLAAVALSTTNLAAAAEPSTQGRGYGRSVFYLQMDLPEMALAELDGMREKLPPERELYILYGLLLETLGRYDQAVGRYRQALTMPETPGADGTKGAILAFAGRATRKKGDTRQAESLYREALAADPGVSLASLGLSEILMERGDYAGALPQLDNALAQDPDDVEALLMAGTAYSALGKRDLARKSLERALSLDPGNQHAKTALKSL